MKEEEGGRYLEYERKEGRNEGKRQEETGRETRGVMKSQE